MMGDVIPEPVFDEADYRRQILDPIAAAVGPSGPRGVMEVAFLNARGAIARFDRGSIEIRLMDVQEYPDADLAICAAAIAVIRRLADETWSSFEEQQAVPTATLRRLLDATATDAEQTPIDDEGYLRVLGIDDVPSHGSMPIRASDVWRSLLERGAPEDASLAEFAEPLGVILDRGPLARRIRQRLGSRFTREHLVATYRDVAECLDTWHPFRP
jgi:glutamate---cysteine ligase / carboxylate-amine ligase